MSAKFPGKEENVITPRGKRRKRFLEKNDALSLATAIADIQEKKTLTRSEKYKDQAPHQQKPDRKHTSNSKAKLKETKAILRARSAEAKKGRAKSRKDRLKGSEHSAEHTTGQPTRANPDKAVRKVSFA